VVRHRASFHDLHALLVAQLPQNPSDLL